MKDYPKDKIDLIFKSAIEGVETEPSDRFWNKANEEILLRENSSYRRKIFMWRGVAASLAAVVIVMTWYSFFIQTKVTNVEKRLSEIEKTESTFRFKQQEDLNKKISKNENAKESESVKTGGYQKSQSSGYPLTASTQTPHAFSLNRRSSLYNFKNRQNILYNNKQMTQDTTAVSFQNIAAAGNREVENTPSSDKPVANAENHQAPPNQESNRLPVHDTSVTQNSTPYMQDSTPAGKLSAPADASQALTQKKPSLTLNDILHHIVLYGFYSPFILNDFMESGDQDDQTAADVKAREQQGFEYSTGIKIAYELSNHWSLITGCYYHVSQFSIKPTVIYASDQNSAPSFNLVTSSGVVNFPYSGSPLPTGDSLKIKANSSRNYISIPLQIKYDFTSNHKLRFYVTGGIAAKIAVYETTEVHWENTLLQEGDASVNKMQYLDDIDYAYILGFGATYPLYRKWLIYAEPSIQGSFTSIDKDAPILTYPLNLGIAVGLSYHL